LDKFIIQGGKPLKGEIRISGSKNAALPLMVATLLSPGKYILHNVPELRDIRTMAHLLRIIGAKIDFADHTLIINTTQADFPEAPYELVKTMRASIYVLGPLLARFKTAKVSLPGGCAWGPRPVDLHIKGMQKLGAELRLDGGYIVASCQQLKGSHIHFDISSVGATASVMMAAVLAEGVTTLENAASEPEIIDLGHFLIRLGAVIEGLGTKTVKIEGRPSLHPADYSIIPDRIETGTFLTAARITGGEITLKECQPKHLLEVLDKLKESGAQIDIKKDEITLKSITPIRPVNVTTDVYPGFPTDMQAQWIALMSLAAGSSVVTDSIFTDRFTHVPELIRLGAQIVQKNNSAFVQGVSELKGAPVMSTDLRASASLVIAALAATGKSEVFRVYHIDRGYEKIEQKLQQLGGDIHRESAGEVI
jgi:UDP-N-acetylglucosamine 1-carboxyvinyltransferase